MPTAPYSAQLTSPSALSCQLQIDGRCYSCVLTASEPGVRTGLWWVGRLRDRRGSLVVAVHCYRLVGAEHRAGACVRSHVGPALCVGELKLRGVQRTARRREPEAGLECCLLESWCGSEPLLGALGVAGIGWSCSVGQRRGLRMGRAPHPPTPSFCSASGRLAKPPSLGEVFPV